jgi:hypothetical protein
VAVSRFVLTADATVPAGTASPVSGGPGTVSWSGPGPFAAVYPKGSVIALDPAGSLYTALSGSLREFADTDAVRPGISN